MSFNLIKLLESIFPFLFNALKRAYDNLSETQQTALVNSGTLGQLLKANLKVLGDDLVAAAAKETGLTPQQVTDTYIHLAGIFGFNTNVLNDAVDFLQKKLSGAASTPEWNGILNIILNAGATFLSGGALDWTHIAIGIGEWVYQNFIKGKDLPSIEPTLTTNVSNTPDVPLT